MPMEVAPSRRSFLKCALAGAAATVFGKVQTADTGAGHSPRTSEVTQLSLSEACELIRSRKISPVELTRACLSRIDRLNGKLNAFITVTADSALAQARAAEGEIQRGNWKGALHGMPIALKDLIDTGGVRTTAGSYSNARRRGCASAESGWGGAPRQVEPAGIRLWGEFSSQLLRPGA